MFTEAVLDAKIEALEALVARALLLSGTLGVINLAPALVLSRAQHRQALELDGIRAACSECYAKTAEYGFISCQRACSGFNGLVTGTQNLMSLALALSLVLPCNNTSCY